MIADVTVKISKTKTKKITAWKKSGRNIIIGGGGGGQIPQHKNCACVEASKFLSLQEYFANPKTDVFDSCEADDDVA